MTQTLRSPRFWLLTFAALVVAATTFSLGQCNCAAPTRRKRCRLRLKHKKYFQPLIIVRWQLLKT